MLYGGCIRRIVRIKVYRWFLLGQPNYFCVIKKKKAIQHGREQINHRARAREKRMVDTANYRKGTKQFLGFFGKMSESGQFDT